MTEAKNQLSALLAAVRAGESIVIVDRGVPVARLEGVARLGEDSWDRLARLERSGVVHPSRQGSRTTELLLSAPPRAERGAGVTQALIDERRRGR